MSKKEMSKEEMLEMIESLKNDNEILKNSNGESVKNKVMKCIEDGMKSIEDIGMFLKISGKNVSSNLTYLRSDLRSEGKTIISMRIDGKSLLSIKSFEEMGWDIV